MTHSDCNYVAGRYKYILIPFPNQRQNPILSPLLEYVLIFSIIIKAEC